MIDSILSRYCPIRRVKKNRSGTQNTQRRVNQNSVLLVKTAKPFSQQLEKLTLTLHFSSLIRMQKQLWKDLNKACCVVESCVVGRLREGMWFIVCFSGELKSCSTILREGGIGLLCAFQVE